MVYQILWYLPARDLKTIRLVNKLLSTIGRNNIFWSSLSQLKWSQKLCLTTLPVPSPSLPPDDDDAKGVADTETYLREMTNFGDHTYDELKPATLWEIAHYFPAFTVLEGSWMRAYNLIEQHFEVGYLHSVVRRDCFAVSDTQWELYPPSAVPMNRHILPYP